MASAPPSRHDAGALAETAELVGPVRDQAELQGLFQRLTDLGLTLLSASEIDDEQQRQ